MWALFKLGAAVAVSVMLGGCAGEADGDRRLTKIRDELARVQADRDRVDQRLLALETKGIDAPVTPPPPRPAETPALRVVRISPDTPDATSSKSERREGVFHEQARSAEETASAVDEGSPTRPVLRVVGDGRAKRRGEPRASDRIEQTMPPPEVPVAAVEGSPSIREGAPRPSALDPAARRAYDDALAMVNGRRCQQALDAFAGFLVRWPDHPNADNAMYWRGECYAQIGDLPRAIEQYEGTVARFPMGNKVPDALLKLGMAYVKLGDTVRAKGAWDRLEREFPLSEARRRIPNAASQGKSAPSDQGKS